jgi:hypothetical protein
MLDIYKICWTKKCKFNGAELVVDQELLGNNSPGTTLQFAHITKERKREQHKILSTVGVLLRVLFILKEGA